MSKKVLTDLDFQGVSKATNLPAPASASDAATKGYVDGIGFVTTFAGLQDVDVSTKTDHSVVYFSAADAKFKADGLDTFLSLTDGGNF